MYLSIASGISEMLIQLPLDVKSSPAAIAGDAAGVSHANSGSPTDQLTRAHRMTLDEAALILNVKKDTPLEQVLKVSFSPIFMFSLY
jgi:hypothetical protein